MKGIFKITLLIFSLLAMDRSCLAKPESEEIDSLELKKFQDFVVQEP